MMNPKLQPLFARRSVRKYQSKDVPDELVRDLLEAGMAAPSACAKDPWRFVVVKDRKQLARVAEGLPYGKMLNGAGVGIVACGDLPAANDGQLSYLLQDCSAAIENILLAASLLGLGGVWLGVHPREDRMAHMTKVLGLPKSVIPIGVLSIGWPAETPPARTRFAATSVHKEQW